MRTVIETYLDKTFKDEPIEGYNIDSLVIKNITEKERLKKESSKYVDLSLEQSKKSNKVIEDYKNIRDIANLGGLDISKEKAKYKAKAENLLNKALEYKGMAEKLAKESLEADSTQTLYYYVIAKGTITSLKNVQKNATIPFHISEDYKIIKEPLEFQKNI